MVVGVGEWCANELVVVQAPLASVKRGTGEREGLGRTPGNSPCDGHRASQGPLEMETSELRWERGRRAKDVQKAGGQTAPRTWAVSGTLGCRTPGWVETWWRPVGRAGRQGAVGRTRARWT